MKSIWTLTEAVNLATRFEQQLLQIFNRSSYVRRNAFENNEFIGRTPITNSAESSLHNQRK